MFRKLRKTMLYLFSIIAVLALGIYVFMQTSPFGQNPEGARLERTQKSLNYKEGELFKISILHPIWPKAQRIGKS